MLYQTFRRLLRLLVKVAKLVAEYKSRTAEALAATGVDNEDPETETDKVSQNDETNAG
jgi:hypothetical protein